ncbi:MAG: DUF190 domain-containing protein [Candidatus Obscuribacterales bacterium]|nr:DUF190 domain-containing protein [Candidatus Obscuribacterales bacterium]
MLATEGYLLRIFIGESDKQEGRPLYEWILVKAKEHGLSGGTVFRGIAGFGGSSQIHTAKLLELSSDLPIVIEIVDSLEKIDAFLPVIDGAIHGGLATVEKANIRLYRMGKK